MPNRLISFNNLKEFISGATSMSLNSETALGLVLDGVSKRMERAILGGQLVGELADGLKQASATGTYGPADYGEHDRNVILLRRHLNVSSVTSITDDDAALDADDFFLIPELGAIRLAKGRDFSDKPRAIEIVYTAGYSETGSGSSLELSVPEDLQIACAQQVSYEWGRRQGGGGYGASSVVFGGGGSVQFQETDWIKPVAKVIEGYARPKVI